MDAIGSTAQLPPVPRPLAQVPQPRPPPATEAAQARHEATLARAENAIRNLSRPGGRITYRSVAEAADVSRSWFYRQQALRDQIDPLRARTAGVRTDAPPAERATATPLTSTTCPQQ